MILAVGSLAAMGTALGALLGIASRYLAVEENPIELELAALLPGSQCGQCGYVGCAQAAKALAAHEAPVTLCPPGGKAVAEALAKKLGVTADLSEHEEHVPSIAYIDESLCLGCLRCAQECSVDAIVGAAKQMHTVIAEACHGCGKCEPVCNTMAITLKPIPKTVATWYWPKPGGSVH